MATVGQQPDGARLLLLIGPLSGLGSLCIDMYLPALLDISRDLQARASTTQASLTTCLVGLALGQVLVGPVSDRLGRRPPLLCGLAAFVAAAFACSFAPNSYDFLALRFVQGLAAASGIGPVPTGEFGGHRGGVRVTAGREVAEIFTSGWMACQSAIILSMPGLSVASADSLSVAGIRPPAAELDAGAEDDADEPHAVAAAAASMAGSISFTRRFLAFDGTRQSPIRKVFSRDGQRP